MALPNLPIPRELRDQIYGYLLNSTYTRVVRSGRDNDENYEEYHTFQAYKFETAILAVNRQIHNEAEEYLYKNNVFIVASLEWPRFATGLFSGMLWVPIVNTKNVSKMKHHTMRLHFTPNQAVRPSAPGYRAGDKVPVETFLLLEKDFRAFCNTMRYHVGFLSGFTIGIADEGPKFPGIAGIGGLTSEPPKAIKPASMMIQFRDTPFRAADAALQLTLLHALEKISCASMRVSIAGNYRIEDPDYIRNLKELMGPVLISKHAAMWANFEILCTAKEIADETAHSGELLITSWLYARVFLQIHDIHSFHGGAFLVTWQPLEALRLDLLCTLGYLKIKMGDLPGLPGVVRHLVAWLSGDWTATSLQAPTSKHAEAYVQHLLILSNLYLLDAQTMGYIPTTSVKQMIDALTELELTPHVLHDLTIIKKVVNTKEPAYKHLPLSECSAHKLPLPRLAFHQTPVVPKKPVHIVGRQNLESIRRLDETAKQEINIVQRMYGQPITEWE